MTQKSKEHTHQEIVWKTYEFVDEFDLIEKKCRVCWETTLYIREKGKNV
jgi:hypothetical protein